MLPDLSANARFYITYPDSEQYQEHMILYRNGAEPSGHDGAGVQAPQAVQIVPALGP